MTHPHLSLDHIKELEAEVISICNHCKSFPELETAAKPYWDWACHALSITPAKLRHEIETHTTDEHFKDEYSEEKDHLLKLPLVVLEHLHQK